MSTEKGNVGLSNPQEHNVDVGTLYVTFLIAQAKLEIQLTLKNVSKPYYCKYLILRITLHEVELPILTSNNKNLTNTAYREKTKWLRNTGTLS